MTARIVTEESPNWNSIAPNPAPAADPAADEAGDVAAMSFEQALAELERIVQELERGQLELDAAIKAYERGTRLKSHCTSKLREAQLSVERISLSDAGKVQTEPVEIG